METTLIVDSGKNPIWQVSFKLDCLGIGEFMSRSTVKLFVKSVETSDEESSTKRRAVSGRGGWVVEVGMFGQGKVYREPSGHSNRPSSDSVFGRGTNGFVLPLEQQQAVEMVRSLVLRAGLAFKVVDIGRMNAFHRKIQGVFSKITRFPTLVLSSGQRIESNITEEQVIRLLVATRNERKLPSAPAISPKHAVLFRGARQSVLRFYERLMVFLRFVCFLEKDPKHGVLNNESFIAHIEVIFGIIVLPLSVSCLLIWAYYGFFVCLAYMALITFGVLEIFHFAFDR